MRHFQCTQIADADSVRANLLQSLQELLQFPAFPTHGGPGRRDDGQLSMRVRVIDDVSDRFERPGPTRSENVAPDADGVGAVLNGGNRTFLIRSANG